MTPTLLAFLDDVEHNRIPADEVRHRARLARGELKRLSAPIEGVDVGKLAELLAKATPGPWSVLPANQHHDDYVVTGHPDFASGPDRPWRHVLADVSYLFDKPHTWDGPHANAELMALAPTMARALLSLATSFPERVAEAVMGEREAILAFARKFDTHATFASDFYRGFACAIDAVMTSIRSRPAPAHPPALTPGAADHAR